MSPGAIRDTGEDELQELIRPSGFFRTKAKKLRALCEFLGERYGDSLEAMSKRSDGELREELLSIYGVGDETADDIMLYSFGRPVFVVDAYTRRIFGRLGLVDPKLKYAALPGGVPGQRSEGCRAVQRVSRADSHARQGGVQDTAGLLGVSAGRCLSEDWGLARGIPVIQIHSATAYGFPLSRE